MPRLQCTLLQIATLFPAFVVSSFYLFFFPHARFDDIRSASTRAQGGRAPPVVMQVRSIFIVLVLAPLRCCRGSAALHHCLLVRLARLSFSRASSFSRNSKHQEKVADFHSGISFAQKRAGSVIAGHGWLSTVFL